MMNANRIRTRTGVLLIAFLLLAMAAAGCGSKSKDAEAQQTTTQQTSTSGSGSDNSSEAVKQWSEMPEMAIDPNKTYTAVFHTSKGDFKVALFADEAPTTVNNFVFLSKQKYYDGISFHRIIESFMIQTGDPNGDGSGGPGYHIPDELGSDHKYDVGTVAMAKTQEPNSGGSQFFICTGKDCSNLNQTPDYTIFGKVTEGLDAVTAIAKTPVGPNPMTGEVSVPQEKVTIDSIEIEEK